MILIIEQNGSGFVNVYRAVVILYFGMLIKQNNMFYYLIIMDPQGLS